MKYRAGISQSPRDRVLWVLASFGEKMERGNLRSKVRMRNVLLDTILVELLNEGMIGIDERDFVSLKQLSFI